ncbi:Protoporphyrinogen oxidase [Slackia heliotrinireducens]|uniref:Predicted flavoprotein n=1 Tax=Slackia heliotrinireducens (strain ATCC 29202 / DSM 20476 / NCTC 11029 / RHS 1) TaxID=471855 RepID=C7N6J6_SLAHD|nr:aminoacetone oxidase family FAD-binding enzyme [Slackia heliotrinireducens]ACV22531.1 predicted flavoprotein [Slackia heliotrinireducens DSM 20476]VEH00977.1 Protoporphyrinogen oxidase [Slackia heliotrinireducens]
MKKVAVLGGGASGLAAAIAAGRCGADVTVFEASDRVGKPILATGNGRCNFSNADIMSSDYNRPDFVQAAMNMLPPEDVLLFFADAGLLFRQEDEGRMYPYSNKANTVVDVLRMCAAEAGVVEQCGVAAKSVEEAGGRWRVLFEDGTCDEFDSVIVAVGGGPAKGLVPSDIRYKKTHPVLAPLKTDTKAIKGLNGTRVKARLYLDDDGKVLSEAWMDVVDPEVEQAYQGPETYGEVLFREYGISGIAVFDLSRMVQPGNTVYIDFLPDMDPQEKVDYIYGQVMTHPNRTAAQIMSGILPSNVARAIVVAAGLNPDDVILAEQEVVVLAMVSESFSLEVKGVANPKQAQVTRGGYNVKDFDPSTMECLSHAGLYAAGEALDIDARCGGYNLHWAWTSGILAGVAAAGGSMLDGVPLSDVMASAMAGNAAAGAETGVYVSLPDGSQRED